MASIINTNIASLNAQRNLAMSQTSLATSMQRLSSGLRINSAKDDAAGLAISERFTTQIRGLNQAARNANDGISLAQTAEGALAEIAGNLQRIRELAVQSANATNSVSDRAALDQEVQQRIAEVERVAQQTTFNGQKILDGTFGDATFQVGANVGDIVTIGLSTSMKSGAIGSFVNSTGTNAAGNTQTAVSAGGSGTANIAASANKTGTGANTYGTTAATAYAGVSSLPFTGSNFSLNGTSINNSLNYAGTIAPAYQSGDSAYAKAAAINGSGVPGVAASATTSLSFGTTGGTAGSTDFLALSTAGADTASVGYTLTINGQPVLTYTAPPLTATDVIGATTAGVSIDAAVTSINQYQHTTGVRAERDSSTGNAGNLLLFAADGRNIVIAESVTGLDGVAGVATLSTAFSQLVQAAAATPTAVDQTQNYRGQITLLAAGSVTIGGTQTTAGLAGTTTLLAASGSLASQTVTTTENANSAILSMDAALTSVSTLRSTFGAIQNRFESVIANLSTTSENLSASRSRIQDADFAMETANLSRTQILQQAGTAMVAQANQLPQGVLALLRQ